MASGVLSGKISMGYRKVLVGQMALAEKVNGRERIFEGETVNKLKRIREIATSLDATMSQLALAWCLKNKNVSSVILGASSLNQPQKILRQSK